MTSMTFAEFRAAGETMFGNTRWGKKMAEATGLGTATISDYFREKREITPKAAEKIRAAVAKHTGRCEGAISLRGTEVEGAACYKLRLVAQELGSNRFVKVSEVNPALFFDKFAPQPMPVAQFVAAPAGVASPVVRRQQDDEALSDEEILSRIDRRVRTMDRVARSVINGEMPSMIVYGGPGIGKSYSIMRALEETAEDNADFQYEVVKGSVSAPALYKKLYEARDGGILVLDDADGIFKSEDALNLLKAALDSSEVREISWAKQALWMTDEGIPQSFVFNGGVIFITNKNLRAEAESGKGNAEHFGALMSRSLYIDLTIETPRALALRVRQVFIDGGMAAKMGLSPEEAVEVAEFIEENRHRLTEISLRMANLITKVYLAEPETWEETIEITKMR